MGSGIDFIEDNLILEKHLSYYIPFVIQPFPVSLWSVLAFPDNLAEKAGVVRNTLVSQIIIVVVELSEGKCQNLLGEVR